jgi:Glycosyltransferase sugar-binding region containing DXD motif
MVKSKNLYQESVNGLWIGSKLTRMEVLTILSFLQAGYHFKLWTYNPQIENVPEKAQILDAEQIIPKGEVFCYRKTNKFGHGKGSFAGFSDIFRYKLLLEHGGWWTDMDVSCLKALPITPYFFRGHHSLKLVGNVMRCEKGSEMMEYCFHRAKNEIDEKNTDWHKPIKILIEGVEKYDLAGYIYNGLGNLDHWTETNKYVFRNSKIPEEWRFIHWQNEEWRNRGLDKNRYRYRSTLGKLLQKHGILKKTPTLNEQLINEINFWKAQTKIRIRSILNLNYHG